jgi:hypothetical protein
MAIPSRRSLRSDFAPMGHRPLLHLEQEWATSVTLGKRWGCCLLIYWQPENANVAALTLAPGVAVRFVLVDVELVCISDGLQSGVIPPVTNARASTV